MTNTLSYVFKGLENQDIWWSYDSDPENGCKRHFVKGKNVKSKLLTIKGQLSHMGWPILSWTPLGSFKYLSSRFCGVLWWVFFLMGSTFVVFNFVCICFAYCMFFCFLALNCHSELDNCSFGNVTGLRPTAFVLDTYLLFSPMWKRVIIYTYVITCYQNCSRNVNFLSEDENFKILAVNVEYDCDYLFSNTIINFTSEHRFIQNKCANIFGVECLFSENCLHYLTNYSFFLIKWLKSCNKPLECSTAFFEVYCFKLYS